MQHQLTSRPSSIKQNSIVSQSDNKLQLPHQNCFSLTTAFNRLKEVEERLEKTKGRVQILFLNTNKHQSQVKEIERQKFNRSMIQKNNYERKMVKYSSFIEQQNLQEKRRATINYNRTCQKEIFEQTKKMQWKYKNDTYLQLKRDSKKWEEQIQRNKKRQLREKQKKRVFVKQKEIIGAKRRKQYLEGNIMKIKEQKNAQIKQINHIIKEKQKIATKLERFGSISYLSENPQEIISKAINLSGQYMKNKNKVEKIYLRKHKKQQKNQQISKQKSEVNLIQTQMPQVQTYKTNFQTY